MGKIGWSVIYATEALFAAPVLAGTAVLAGGYWLEEAVRNTVRHPSWVVDNQDDLRLDRRLADLAADSERGPTRAQPGSPDGGVPRLGPAEGLRAL